MQNKQHSNDSVKKEVYLAKLPSKKDEAILNERGNENEFHTRMNLNKFCAQTEN